MIDRTHSAAARSWVESANGHAEFPIQNLPLGVFSPPGGSPRGGIAIGDRILDLAAAAGLFAGEAKATALAASGASLNPLMALGRAASRALRLACFDLLDADGESRRRAEPLAEQLLHDMDACALHLPATIGNYTDFYAGIRHAENVGRLFRPDDPLLPNYKYVPIGYHGRASSVRASGTPVVRPSGQRKRPGETGPSFGSSRNLDYELELAVWVCGANELGRTVPIETAGERLFGLGLLNDWSARDLQSWEYQPLGPFLAKSFVTTVSPWIVTMEALAPFRVPQAARPAGDPRPLPYLYDPHDQAEGAFDIALDVSLRTASMRGAGAPFEPLARVSASHLYWTIAQLLTHHTSNGCNLLPGDLLGTGTISGTDLHSVGSLLELTGNGRSLFTLSNGETRTFLEDGDEVRLAAHASKDGFVGLGFGECRGLVVPAP